MAIDRKDITLALKGENRTQQSFGQATKAVRDLTAAIKEQVDGVRTGRTSLDDLKDSLQEIESVGKSLAGQQGLIDSFRGQTAALTNLGARADAAKTKLAAFVATLDAGGSRTVAQEKKLATLNSTVEKTGKVFATAQTQLATTGAALDAVGIDTRELDAASKSLLSSSNLLGAGFTTVKTTVAGYGRVMRTLAAEEKAAADAARSKAATIAQVNAAMARAAEQQAKLVQAVRNAEAKAAQDAAANAAARAAATDKEVATIDAEMRALNRLIERRNEAARTQSIGGARVQGRGGVEAAVNAIVSPTSGQRNIANIGNELTALSTAVTENLGKPVANYLGLLQDLERTLKNVQNVAKQVDGYKAQKAATDAAHDAVEDHVIALQRLYDAYHRDPTPENSRKVREGISAHNQFSAALLAEQNALKVLHAELRRAGVDTQALVDVEKRLVDMTKNVTSSIRNLNQNYEKFGGSRREGAAGLLGMRPYEIQNLSFQINDFFTQLASGTSVTQAFAQQIGQVAQIQPIWTRIVAFAPAFVVLATAIGTTVSALVRLNETTRSTRNFAALIEVSNLGGLDILPARLTQIARDVEKLGFSFDEARKSLLSFANSGVVIERDLQSAVELAARYSRVFGVEMPAATQLFVQGLTQGREGFEKLLDAGVRFEPSVRRNIEALLEQGRQLDAQRAILEALSGSFRTADENALSPFARSTRDLSNAWKGLLDQLGNTGVIQALTASLNGLARVIGYIADTAPRIAAILGIAADLPRIIGGSAGFARPDAPPAAPATPGSAPATPPRGAPVVQDIEREHQAEAALNGVLADRLALARRLASERERERIIGDKTEAAARRREAVTERARQRVLGRTPGIADTAEGRRIIQGEIANDLREFNEKLRQETESASRSGAAAVRRDLAAISTDLQNTIRIRDEAVRGIQEDVAAGAVSPAAAIEKIREAAEQARPEIARLRAEAQAFLDSGRGRSVVRDSAAQRLIAQADRQLTGNTGERAGVNAVLQQQQTEIRQAFQERAQFVQTQTALEQQGVQTREESEARIVALYGQTRTALLANIDAYAAANEAARANGTITQEAAANNAASVELWRVQLERIDPAWARMKQGFENVIGQSAMTAFDSVAQSIGEVLAGTKSITEAFEDAGKAALQFVADVLKGIAQVILQEQILIAVKLISKAISSGFSGPAGGGVRTAHTGTVVGSPGGVVRSGVHPGIFDGAPRMHDGGVVGGLRGDERAAILQTGEEVLARDDARNIRNRGKGVGGVAPAPMVQKNILAVGDDEIANAMNTGPGEQVVMNILRRNATSLRAMVRG